MTRDSTVDNPDDGTPETASQQRPSMKRRSLLALAVSTPLLATEPQQATGRQDRNFPVRETDLPDEFEPYQSAQMPRLNRRLISNDENIDQERFNQRIFIDVPSGRTNNGVPEHPRYGVAVTEVDTSRSTNPSVVTSVARDEFTRLMERYTGPHSVTSLTDTQSSTNPHTHEFNCTIEFDGNCWDISWFGDDSSPELSEHWAVHRSSEQAFITAVYGYNDGPWSPQALYTDITSRVSDMLK